MSTRELFFVAPAGRIVAAPTALTPSFSKGTPAALFDGRLEELSRQYDVTPDGQRFILAQRAPPLGRPDRRGPRLGERDRLHEMIPSGGPAIRAE